MVSIHAAVEGDQGSTPIYIEMRFAHLKVHHGFERTRLGGLSSVRDKFHLAVIVKNLKLTSEK
jgi:Transposase DDE domain